MKKLIFAFAGLCALTAVAAPRLDDRIVELNGVVADLLKPYQSNLTAASLEIKSLTSDETKVLTLSALADYRHVGKVQTISGAITKLTLNYDMGRPVADMSANAIFDFTKAFHQSDINQFVKSWPSLAANMIQDKLKDFGPAATVKVIMLNQFRNRNGDSTGFRSLVTAKIDITKLPRSLKIEDVAFFDASLEVRAEATRGVMATGKLKLNPAYKHYGELKDKLEKLVDRDAGEAKDFTGKFEKLDQFATGLSDTAASRD